MLTLADASYNAEIHGETLWLPPAVFYEQMGWYDQHDATNLYKLPPKGESKRGALVAIALEQREGRRSRHDRNVDGRALFRVHERA